MAAKDLLALRGRKVAVVGEEGFDDGGEQGDFVGGILAHRGVRMVPFHIQQQRGVHSQCAAAFVVSARGQQHAAHVRVHDDRVSWLVRGFGARQGPHLQAVLGIGRGVLVGHFTHTQPLQAHREAGGIEHHLAGGVAVDAHLVL